MSSGRLQRDHDTGAASTREHQPVLHAVHEHQSEAVLCLQAAEARWRWRRENGAADVDLPEANLRVRDAHAPGAAVTCVISQRNFSPARQLVQEMMILAGQVVGDLGVSGWRQACCLMCALHKWSDCPVRAGDRVPEWAAATARC